MSYAENIRVYILGAAPSTQSGLVSSDVELMGSENDSRISAVLGIRLCVPSTPTKNKRFRKKRNERRIILAKSVSPPANPALEDSARRTKPYTGRSCQDTLYVSALKTPPPVAERGR